jgi:CTD small phosphatase-like protein 2
MNEIKRSFEKPIEEKNEEYQIIRENYKSSPRCGIKSLFVKKVKKNIIFSPIEISANPYFKYSITQIKEEQKTDISFAETNQTKIKEDKNKINFDSTNKLIKTEKLIDKEDEDREKESEETNYIHIVEKKASEITVNKSFKYFDINNNNNEKDKKNKYSSNILRTEKGIKYFYHKSLNDKETSGLKLKLNLNEKKNIEDIHKATLKNTQLNIYNILNNIIPKKQKSNLNNNTNNELFKSENNLEMVKAKSTFNIHSLIQKKNKNEKKISPKNTFLKMENGKINYSHSNNFKKFKKTKKTENELKLKKHVMRQHSFMPNKLNKDNKIQTEEKEEHKSRRHSLLPLNENDNRKNSKKIYIKILNNNQGENKIIINKTSSLYKKMKSSGEKANKTFKFIKSNKKFELDKCNTPKRKINGEYKLKMDDLMIDLENNHSSKKTRKVSITASNNNLIYRRKIKNNNDDAKGDNHKRKKSIFFNLKEKEKEKERDKEKNRTVIDKSGLKEKKTKRKKRKKSKQKEEKDEKDKMEKKDKNNCHDIRDQPIRKDKSFSIKTSNINKTLSQCHIKNKSSKNNSNDNEMNLKNNSNDNKDSNEVDDAQSDVRRNSTRNLCRTTNNKEKIIALTNKQTIDNINEYTRQCLQIIPELYELKDKMPRCKAKVNPNFSKDKKIALFDLDETIVHCIGEINMNNLESLSLQSDAKIKVHLPGGKKEVTVGINIRPNWEEALKRIKEKYHIIAFTASHESYADSVLNYLDSEKKYFEFRLYRCHCVPCSVNGMKFYVKDLKILEDNYDLKDLILVDNSVLSFAYHLDNGIPISPFYDSKDDKELLTIADFLLKYADENDIRNKLKEVYKLNYYLEILKDYTSEENYESSDSSPEKDKINENEKLNNSSSFKKNDTKHEDNNELIELGKTKKNISQINLSLKEISKIFDNGDIRERNNKIPTLKISSSKKFKNIDKRYCQRKSKANLRTILFDINFKKEWDEKQKELKNKK